MVVGAAPREGRGQRYARRRVTVTGNALHGSEGNLSVIWARHESEHASHRQRTAARTDEVRLPGRSPHPCRKAISVKLRCEAARPTDRQRAAGREGSGPAAAGPRITQSHRGVQRYGTRDADLQGQLPGAKRLSSQQKPQGETSSQRPVQRHGRRSRLSPAGKASRPPEDSRPGAPRSAATPAPGGRAPQRTRARSALVLAQPGAPRRREARPRSGREVNKKEANSVTNEKDTASGNVTGWAKARSA